MYKVLKNILFKILSLVFKNKKAVAFTKDKVVVFAFSRIGDTVFQIPAIKLILENHSNITFVISENSKTILETYFKKSLNTIIVRKEDFLKDRIPSKKIINKIIVEKPEIFIDLSGNIISALIIARTGAKNIIGFNEPEFQSLYTHYSSKRTKPHLIDLYLEPLLRYYNSPVVNKEFESNYNACDPIFIHPFAGWKAKEWGFDNFLLLANELNKIHKTFIIAEEKLLSNQPINYPNIIKTKSIDELLSCIKNCSIFISNDSGPLYLAAMMGKPTFTIYGPTNPDYSKPYGEHHRVLSKKVKCSPINNSQYCFTDAGRKGCAKFICLEEIDNSVVLHNIKNFMEFLNLK